MNSNLNSLIENYTLYCLQNSIELSRYEGLYKAENSNKGYVLYGVIKGGVWVGVGFKDPWKTSAGFLPLESARKTWDKEYRLYDDTTRTCYYSSKSIPGFTLFGQLL